VEVKEALKQWCTKARENDARDHCCALKPKNSRTKWAKMILYIYIYIFVFVDLSPYRLVRLIDPNARVPYVYGPTYWRTRNCATATNTVRSLVRRFDVSIFPPSTLDRAVFRLSRKLACYCRAYVCRYCILGCIPCGRLRRYVDDYLTREKKTDSK